MQAPTKNMKMAMMQNLALTLMTIKMLKTPGVRPVEEDYDSVPLLVLFTLQESFQHSTLQVVSSLNRLLTYLANLFILPN